MQREVVITCVLGGAAFVASVAATPVVRAAAIRLRIFDKPDSRKLHDKPVPYLGGVALFFAYAASLGVMRLLYPQGWIPQYLWVCAAQALIVLLGVVDDIRGCPVVIRLGMEFLVGLLFYACGVSITLLTNPFGPALVLPPFLAAVATGLWVVIMINSINLIDGLDGLAAGISAIAAAALVAINITRPNWYACMFAAILVGMNLGFLPYNFHPAKIFMGDAGSLFLGSMFAVLSLAKGQKSDATVALLVPMVAIGLPLSEAVWSFVRRTFAGQHPFRGDRRHVHHRLLSIGLSHRQVVLLLYYVGAYMGLVAYILSRLDIRNRFSLMVILGMGMLLGIRALTFIETRLEVGLAGRRQPPDDGE